MTRIPARHACVGGGNNLDPEAVVDPKVLIDNNVFPVPAASREDSPLELALHTFDAENTIVRNIEDKETAYDKMESVVPSASRKENKPFPFETIDDFADGISFDDFTAWSLFLSASAQALQKGEETGK